VRDLPNAAIVSWWCSTRMFVCSLIHTCSLNSQKHATQFWTHIWCTCFERPKVIFQFVLWYTPTFTVVSECLEATRIELGFVLDLKYSILQKALDSLEKVTTAKAKYHLNSASLPFSLPHVWPPIREMWHFKWALCWSLLLCHAQNSSWLRLASFFPD